MNITVSSFTLAKKPKSFKFSSITFILSEVKFFNLKSAGVNK